MSVDHSLPPVWFCRPCRRNVDTASRLCPDCGKAQPPEPRYDSWGRE